MGLTLERVSSVRNYNRENASFCYVVNCDVKQTLGCLNRLRRNPHWAVTKESRGLCHKNNKYCKASLRCFYMFVTPFVTFSDGRPIETNERQKVT